MCSALRAMTSTEVSSLTSEVHHPSQSWSGSLFRNITISLTISLKKRGGSGRFTLSSRDAFPPSNEDSLCRRRGDRLWLRAFKAGNRWWRLPHIGRYDDGTAPCSPKLRGGTVCSGVGSSCFSAFWTWDAPFTEPRFRGLSAEGRSFRNCFRKISYSFRGIC